MYDLSFGKAPMADHSVIRAEIRKKLDEHVEQILEKPAISAEEHHLLEWVEKQYAEADKAIHGSVNKKPTDDFWLPILFSLVFSSFGGDK